MNSFNKILVILSIFTLVIAQDIDFNNKRLTKISVLGNERYSESYLKKQIEISPARTKKAMEKISNEFIVSQAQQLQRYYQEEGFLKASVRDSLVQIGENRLNLYYVIEENQRYYINQNSYDLRLRTVNILGNETFSDASLKRFIEIKPARTRRAMLRVNKRYINTQARNIRNYYISEGFLNAQVRDSLVIVKDRHLHLYFNVKEKDRYYVKQIKVEGNTLLSDAEILELLGQEVGGPFKQFEYYNNFKKILARYSELGHPYAEIGEEYIWENDLEITLKINEDLPYTIDKILLEGNERVYDPYIEKHYKIKEGSGYEREDISRTQDRIYEMGAFSSVNIVPINADTTEQELDLRVSVIESKPRRFDVKFGGRQGFTDRLDYSSLFIEPEWMHKNLFHRAHRLRASLSYDAIFHLNNIDHKINSELAYTVPWLFFLRLPTTAKLYYDRNTHDPFEETIDTVSVGEVKTEYGIDFSSIWRYNRNTYTRFSLSLRNVKYEYEGSSTGFIPEAEIGLQTRIDNRDSFIYPTKGWNILAYSGYVLGAQTEYFRMEGSLNAYIPLTPRTVIASRIEMGQFFEVDSIAPQDLYQLGSESTVRAWRKSIGNIYELTTGDTIKAGKAKVLANLELRQDMFWNIGMNVFIDAGRLDSDMTGIFNWDSYFVNVGAGIYYRTPIGPIRVELPIILNDPRVGEKDIGFGTLCFGVLFAF